MADHNENLKDTLNEEIEHADQKPAEEHYSLNDDRRVKVLSPGMLVTKRFFRNRLAVTGMAILVFMFVFSFIGGLISPYEQDKFFYADKTIRREFAAVIKNTEFRYSSADDSVFGLPAQAQAMLAIQQQKDGFTYRDNRFTLTKEAEDFYSVSVNGQVVGLAYKSVVSPSASDATLSFEFTYQALKAYLTDGADTFTADGKTYTVDESGSVMDGTTEVAYVSPYVVQALMPDVFLSRDFKDKLIDTINAGGEKFTYTDESLIVDEEPATDEEDGTSSAITPDDSQMPDDTPRSATAEYDISFDAATNSWSVLQEQTGEADTVGAATKMAGISRSAFYKYKDAVQPFNDMKSEHIITFYTLLKDVSGTLSSVLGVFAASGANILTINQSIPTNGCAAVTISAETSAMEKSLEQLITDISALDNVIKFEILAG